MTMNTGNSMYMGNNISSRNESTSKALKSDNNHVINQINFETSAMIAKSLKELLWRQLKNTTLKSTGLMQIPIEMKTESAKKFS
jgi:hypothetical protein